MDIDMQTLRLLEREREISLDVLVSAIEQALLSAYHRTPGAQTRARVEVDRKTGHVTVWAREAAPVGEPDDEGILPPPGPDGPEFDDTPDGFGRIATATARQVIVQRLRDAEDDQVLGAFRGKEGEVLGGVIQQGRDPRTVLDRRRRHRGGPARARAGARRGVRARRPDPRLRPRGRPRASAARR